MVHNLQQNRPELRLRAAPISRGGAEQVRPAYVEGARHTAFG
jgi:hypothetical protein